MTPEKLAADIRSIADRIDRSEKPDARLVTAAIRRVIAAVDSPGIMSRKPQMDQAFLKVVLDRLDSDDSHATELVAVEDLVAQAVYDATAELAATLAELETEYGYKFDWVADEGDELEPEPEEPEAESPVEAAAGPGLMDEQ